MIKPTLYSYFQLLDPLINALSNPYAFQLIVEDNRLSIRPLYPGTQAKLATEGFHSRIFTSATLSPPKEVAYLLGLEDFLSIKIKPVFDDENYLPFFIGGVNSSAKEELRELDGNFTGEEEKILATLFTYALSAARGRNVGVFCTSKRTVQEVHRYLAGLRKSLDFLILTFITETKGEDEEVARRVVKLSDDYEKVCRLLKKPPEFVDNPTAVNYIDAFKEMGAIDKTTLLVGVQGGSLSEGVEYIGDDNKSVMEMVIAVGLPYPSSAAERRINQVKSDFFYAQRGDRELGEDLAYRHNAFRKLAQSIGRAHRCLADRAVVICADERLMGIKNIAGEGNDRYEYLNLENANNHLRLLQRPLGMVNGNIVFLGEDKFEEAVLRRYITAGLESIDGTAVVEDDFITFQQMAERIGKFYTRK